MKLPTKAAQQQLAEMGWDYDDTGVELAKSHLNHALTRYISGAISASDVEQWANFVEGRDDVSIREADKHVIEEVLYELANPLLTQPLDMARAAELVGML